jgi:hypothetical protein
MFNLYVMIYIYNTGKYRVGGEFLAELVWDISYHYLSEELKRHVTLFVSSDARIAGDWRENANYFKHGKWSSGSSGKIIVVQSGKGTSFAAESTGLTAGTAGCISFYNSTEKKTIVFFWAVSVHAKPAHINVAIREEVVTGSKWWYNKLDTASYKQDKNHTWRDAGLKINYKISSGHSAKAIFEITK